MKTITTTALLLPICFLNAQNIQIPDAELKNTLLHTNCAQMASPAWLTDVDINNDGEIQMTEAANVLKLDISTSPYNLTGNISNMTGLENFVNLTELDCSGNSITNLNLTSFPNLTVLNCNYNQLTSLDASAVANLTDLRCFKNQLNALNIDGLVHLKLVYCGENNLAQINISGLTALENFECDSNQITNLSLGNNIALKFLYAPENLLTALDIQSTPNLTELTVSGNALSVLNFDGLNFLSTVNVISNQLTHIDLSQAPLVNTLYCGNNPNLTSINVRNGFYSWGDPDLLYFPFRFEELPNLTSICMDDGEQNWLINTDFNSNGNVHIFGGPDCNVPLEIAANSIGDFDLQNLTSVYPNPAENELKIEVKANMAIQSVIFYNLLGQKLMTIPHEAINKLITIDLSILKSGTYLIEINSGQAKATKKFFKN